MDLEHNFNYNNLIELTELFREKKEDDSYSEYCSKLFITWEDIKMVQENPHKDWTKFTGPKFFLHIHGYANPKLIYGDINELITFWQAFRNEFPLWTKPQPDDEEDETR